MTAPFVHWNGRLVPAGEARVSVLDAGFLYGDGVYETMRAYGGRVFAVDRHLARLARSAQAIRLPLPDDATVVRAIEEVVTANGAPHAAVRLTVTRGQLSRRLDLSSAGAPSVLVATDALDPAQDDVRRRGIRVVHSQYHRSSTYELAGVKSTNYQVSLFARNEARRAGADEVLLANETGSVVEAAAANVFLVDEDGVVTPPLDAGILGGITREVCLELLDRRGVEVEEAALSPERMAVTREMFLTGTTLQVAPVVQIGETAVGDGQPGSVTMRLLADYLEAVRLDTGWDSSRASPSTRR